MKLTQHIKERYTERLRGISDIPTRNKFMYDHSSEIEAWVNKMTEYGEVIYKGTVGDKYPNRTYYRNGEFIVVVNADTETAITIFEISFGLSQEGNKAISKIVTDEIMSLKIVIDTLTENNQELATEYDNRLAEVDLEIDELNESVNKLKMEKAVLGTNKGILKSKEKEKNLQLEQLFVKMIGKGFGEDIKKK